MGSYLFGHHSDLSEYGLEVGPHEHYEEDMEQGYQDDSFCGRGHRHWKKGMVGVRKGSLLVSCTNQHLLKHSCTT